MEYVQVQQMAARPQQGEVVVQQPQEGMSGGRMPSGGGRRVSERGILGSAVDASKLVVQAATN